jgi:CDP-glucose 4,6-dehydratase
LLGSCDATGEQTVLPYTEDMPLLAIGPYDVSKACSDLIAQSFARIYALPVVVTRCGNRILAARENIGKVVLVP